MYIYIYILNRRSRVLVFYMASANFMILNGLYNILYSTKQQIYFATVKP